MTPLQHQAAFLSDVALLIQFFKTTPYIVTAGELWRPQEMQDLYFKQGKSKTLSSNHTKRLAIDLNIMHANGSFATLQEIAPAGAFWEKLSTYNRWGGNFSAIKDGPHFERNSS